MRQNTSFALLIFVVVLLMSGCASSPDVKQASSAMTVALDEYQQNLNRFQSIWVKEIEKTRADMGKAIVARSVKLKVKQLSSDFKGRDWQKRFKENGLIAVSEEIEAVQDQARRFVSRLMKLEAGKDESAKKYLDKLLKMDANSLRASANAIEAGQPNEAAELRLMADTLEAGGKQRLVEPKIRSYSEAIIEWGAAKKEILKNLNDLRRVVTALKTTHQTVDGWIQTDVKVSGSQIAELVQRHEQVLLGNQRGSQ